MFDSRAALSRRNWSSGSCCCRDRRAELRTDPVRGQTPRFFPRAADGARACGRSASPPNLHPTSRPRWRFTRSMAPWRSKRNRAANSSSPENSRNEIHEQARPARKALRRTDRADGRSRRHQRRRAVSQNLESAQRSFRSGHEIPRLSGGVGPAGAGQSHAGRVRSRYARAGARSKSNGSSPPSRRWRRTSSFSCCPKIRSTIRTWCSKSAPARAATKPACSRPKSSACTRATPKRSAGKWK